MPKAQVPQFYKFIRMPVDLDQRIRDWRDRHKIPSDAEAIRQLLALALDRAGPKRPPRARL